MCKAADQPPLETVLHAAVECGLQMDSRIPRRRLRLKELPKCERNIGMLHPAKRSRLDIGRWRVHHMGKTRREAGFRSRRHLTLKLRCACPTTADDDADVVGYRTAGEHRGGAVIVESRDRWRSAGRRRRGESTA